MIIASETERCINQDIVYQKILQAIKINHEPDIWNKIKGRPTLIFFISMFLIGPAYDFIIFSYYSIVIDNYNCDTLIKTIENAWYFK